MTEFSIDNLVLERVLSFLDDRGWTDEYHLPPTVRVAAVCRRWRGMMDRIAVAGIQVEDDDEWEHAAIRWLEEDRMYQCGRCIAYMESCGGWSYRLSSDNNQRLVHCHWLAGIYITMFESRLGRSATQWLPTSSITLLGHLARTRASCVSTGSFWDMMCRDAYTYIDGSPADYPSQHPPGALFREAIRCMPLDALSTNIVLGRLGSQVISRVHRYTYPAITIGVEVCIAIPLFRRGFARRYCAEVAWKCGTSIVGLDPETLTGIFGYLTRESGQGREDSLPLDKDALISSLVGLTRVERRDGRWIDTEQQQASTPNLNLPLPWVPEGRGNTLWDLIGSISDYYYHARACGPFVAAWARVMARSYRGMYRVMSMYRAVQQHHDERLLAWLEKVFAGEL